jgi:starch-binding outer membrane protein, SusD/RagB family
MNYNKLIIFLLFFTVLSSCESFLEEKPRDFISPENFPVSQGDAEMMLAGAMQTLYQERMYDRSLYFLAEASSDHTQPSALSGPRFDIGAFTHFSDNEFVWRTWEACYIIINNTNVMITRLPNSQMTEQNINRYVSAAKFLRAFAYFHLVRLYGEVPLIEEPVQDFTSAARMPRNSVSEIYQLIVNDLEDAEQFLPEEWSGMGVGRPDMGACKSLLAEVYITMAGFPMKDQSMWARAATKAKEVIDMGKYQLIGNFADLWLFANRNSVEDIFSIQGLTETTNRSMMSVQTRPGNLPGGNAGWGMWHSTEEFLNTFDDDDERKAASFLTEFGDMTYEQFPRAQPYIKKYFDVGRENFLENNRRGPIFMPLFRYAEILLFYAEALNEANGGPNAEAYNAINQVRTRASMAPLPEGLGQAAFREAVHQERSFELAFECKRRYDLVRWEKFIDVFSNFVPSKDNVRPHHIVFPVPERELLLNPNLGQNQGY